MWFCSEFKEVQNTSQYSLLYKDFFFSSKNKGKIKKKNSMYTSVGMHALSTENLKLTVVAHVCITLEQKL